MRLPLITKLRPEQALAAQISRQTPAHSWRDQETALQPDSRSNASQEEPRLGLEAGQDAIQADRSYGADLELELSTCRTLAPNCLFVIGFARSSTTILLRVLNAADEVLLLTEADLPFLGDVPRFSDWYNARHSRVSKWMYAPDFLPHKDHRWWEWLREANRHYKIVGEKIALSAYHFSQLDEGAIRRFYEARFFDSKFVFLVRDPATTILSLVKMLNSRTDQDIGRQCAAWLRYVMLWADWVRVFPHTLTLTAEDLDAAAIAKVGAFVGVPLENASHLLDRTKTHSHADASLPVSLRVVQSGMGEVFASIRSALSLDRGLWQADQSRSQIGSGAERFAPAHVALQPIGQIWERAFELRAVLNETIGAV